MLKTHAVGIDLGTTYSCIAHLNEHGEPVTLANQEGELTTPSVVLIDDGEAVIGTEALRNAIVRPDQVIQNAKRYMGDSKKRWTIDGKAYTPVDIATLIIKKLLSAAAETLGKIEQAVITVPAQFNELQRQATVEAGLKAGLKRVDIINEPVSAALCYVLGTEGLWFTELADEQFILVYDLGGGTFDLSVVRYEKNEVRVVASAGDLNLGGIDFNKTLLDAIAGQFVREFKVDPRDDPHSLQFMALEVENTKRALSVRPKAALTVQHAGHRKTYSVEQPQFEKLTQKMVDRTCDITRKMLKENQLHWADMNVILTAGGSSRMPMIRNALKKMGGSTLNTTLSPDLSIAHGASYYAGMLLTNQGFAKSILNEKASARLASIKQQDVSARGLGILVRNEKGTREPHYLIPANTPLPAAFENTFGTVIPNQGRVHLHIVESGTAGDKQFVELGTCVIDDLPPNLPENSQISVTISYDEQARVHLSAKDVTSGKVATTTIVREENRVTKDVAGLASGESGATEFRSDDLKLKKETPKTAKEEAEKWTVAPTPAKKPAPVAVKPPPLNPSPVKPAAINPPPVKPAAVKPPSIGVKPTPPSVRPNSRSSSILDDDDDSALEDAGRPVPLCNDCGEALDARGRCSACIVGIRPAASKTVSSGGTRPAAAPVKKPLAGPAGQPRPAGAPQPVRRPSVPEPKSGPASAPRIPIDIDDIMELELGDQKRPASRPASQSAMPVVVPKPIGGKPAPTVKPAPSAATPGALKPTVKAPPLPPGLADKAKKPGIKKGGLSDDGADEFWDDE